MEIMNVTQSVFFNDDDDVDAFNASVVFDNVTTKVVTSVIRHNCTGVDEESMKTYQKVSWWFAGIVQVQIRRTLEN